MIFNNIILYLLLYSTSFLISLSSVAQDRIPQIVKQIESSVVVVKSYDNDNRLISQGSGFFINTAGHVITNLHVLNGATSAKITISTGEIYNVPQIIAMDVGSDLVKILADIKGKNIVPLITNTKDPILGERVIVYGSPLGFSGTLSEGIISSIRNIDNYQKVFQTTAPVSSGSSGSPLINMNGEVIGVITFQYAEGQNINFAIPIDRVNNLINSKSSPTPLYEHVTSKATEDYNKAVAFFSNEVYDRAIYYAKKAIEADQSFSDAFGILGAIYVKKKDYRQAIEAFNSYLRLNPNNDLFFAGRGIIKEYLNDYFGAIQDYNKAIELKPNNDDYYSLRASAKKELGDNRGAQQDYIKAISLNRRNADHHFNHGIICGNLELYYIAIDSFNTAIQLKPTYSEAYFARGNIKVKQKDFTGAIQDFNKAISLNTSYHSAYKNRGLIKMLMGNINGGCIDLSKAGELGDVDVYEIIRKYCR